MALLERLESQKNNETPPATKTGERPKAAVAPRNDPFRTLKSKIHKRVVDELGATEIEQRQLEEAVNRIADQTWMKSRCRFPGLSAAASFRKSWMK